MLLIPVLFFAVAFARGQFGPDPSNHVGFCGVLAYLVLLVGTVELSLVTTPSADSRHLSAVVSCITLHYCGLLLMVDPFFLFSWYRLNLIPTIAFLIPLIVVGMWFAGRHCWAQAVAVALFLWTSVVLIVCNMRSADPSGFFWKIRS
jgi:hypothetical protein